MAFPIGVTHCSITGRPLAVHLSALKHCVYQLPNKWQVQTAIY